MGKQGKFGDGKQSRFFFLINIFSQAQAMSRLKQQARPFKVRHWKIFCGKVNKNYSEDRKFWFLSIKCYFYPESALVYFLQVFQRDEQDLFKRLLPSLQPQGGRLLPYKLQARLSWGKMIYSKGEKYGFFSRCLLQRYDRNTPEGRLNFFHVCVPLSQKAAR